MTDIEKKALELLRDAGWGGGVIRHWHCSHEALCRAIEQHEAYKQEVSDAVEVAKRTYGGHRQAFDQLERFIIAKPDPLVEAFSDVFSVSTFAPEHADMIRAALAKRGLEITEINKEQNR